jgi:hypothetical protein
MPATLRELLIKVGFNVKKEALDNAEKSVERLRKSVMWLAGGVAAASAALFGLVYSASKVGDEFAHLSQVTGIGVENLQRLKEAANLADINYENLVVSLRYFNRTMGNALLGQKMYVTYLRQAGIVSLRDQNGQMKSQIELLKEVADKIKNTASIQQKAAILQNAFGRSGGDLIAMFNLGRSGIEKYMGALDDYGYVLTKVQTQAAATFDAQRKKLLMFVEGAKNAIGIALIPSFNRLIKRLLELIKTNKQLLFQKLIIFFQGLAKVVKTVAFTLYTFGSAVNNLVKSTIGWNRVLEIAGVLLGLLVTRAVINSFRLLYNWVLKLVGASGLLDIVMAPLELILIAVAAAFYLAWDDLKNFEEGNISLIGTLQKSYPTIANFIRVLGGLVGFVKNLVVGTIDSIMDIFKLFVKISEWMDKKLAKLPLIGKMFKKMGDEMKQPGGIVNGILKKTADNLEQINKATQPGKIRLGASPAYQQFLAGKSAPAKATTVNNNVNVNMTLPPGTAKDHQEYLDRHIKGLVGDVLQDHTKAITAASPLYE